jgi:hypothetical protein
MSTPRGSQPSTPSRQQQEERPLTLQEKLQEVQAKADHYERLAADPNLSRGAALAARQLAVSFGAAVSLYQKAIEHEEKINDPVAQANLMRSLGIPPLLPDQGQTSEPPHHLPTRPRPEGG